MSVYRRMKSADEAAQERLKIIEFYDAHGEAETQKYLQVNRKTIHVRKKKLAQSKQRLESLAARSTRPKHVRRMTTNPRCPRINGCIERYQRTLNEEFIQVHEDSIRQPREFLHHLGE